MKPIISGLLLCGVSLLGGVLAWGQPSAPVFLYALDGIVFVTTWSNVLASAEWGPGDAPLPVGVAASLHPLRQAYQVRHAVTNDSANLQWIRIKRFVPAPSQLAASGLVATAVSNRWSVTAEFAHYSEVSGAHRGYVTAMLGGALAQETTWAEFRQAVVHRKTQEAVSPAGRRLPAPQPLAGAKGPPSAKALGTILDWGAELGMEAPPGVQWRPETQEFPVDLAQATRRACEALVARVRTPGYTPVLGELEVWRFTPDEAIRRVGTRLEDHRYHWLIELCFTPRSSWVEPPNKVFVNLEGKVVGVRLHEVEPGKERTGGLGTGQNTNTVENSAPH